MVSTEFTRRVASFITAVCSVLLILLTSPVFPGDTTTGKPSVRLFEIPEYPGTVRFPSVLGFDRLTLPFATVMRVYRTPDGKPLDKEKVIDFYRSHLMQKGWIDGIGQQRFDEGYLSLRVDLYESSPETAHVHLSGNFRLWVAPQDGMITILMDQWRISNNRQETSLYLSGVTSSLEGIAKKNEYYVQKIYYDSGWIEDYENEYMITREKYSFHSNDHVGQHDRMDQTIYLLIRTFVDENTATEEAKRLLHVEPVVEKENHVPIFRPIRHVPIVLVKNKTVIVLSEYSGKQAAVMQQIAAELRKL